ncbi:P1 family peptidase [bacterium]|nr:P1 family peptidase [bacterium]
MQLLFLLSLSNPAAGQPERPRCRDLGICPGTLKPGPYNAITDVDGVRVGQASLRSGQGKLTPGQGPVRTGVTAILGAPDPWKVRLPAATFVLNGNGEMTGMAYLNDIGLLESPILLTNTLNVGRVADAAVSWLIQRNPQIGIRDDVPIAVVAECDDSTLNDIQGRHVGEAQVMAALNGACSGPVEEGDVGAGTGMVAYQFKGGIGTSSRQVEGYTVGVLVMANMGVRSEFTVLGVPVGLHLPEEALSRNTQGSLIVVVATDAPVSQSQLSRMARRAGLGLARTGAVSHHGSGDLVLAFSTANAVPRVSQEKLMNTRWLPDQQLDPLYQAVVEATEESILNSLLRAHTTVGRDGNTAIALPIEPLRQLLTRFGRL